MRISDWSSDVCSSDLTRPDHVADHDLSPVAADRLFGDRAEICATRCRSRSAIELPDLIRGLCFVSSVRSIDPLFRAAARVPSLWTSKEKRSEEHTSELQSLMRTSYAAFCLQTKSNA